MRSIGLPVLRAKWRAEPRGERVALAALMVIATIVRVARLDDPIRLDERLTWVHFVRQPWRIALSDYFIPNNHVFHTLLAKASTEVLGQSLWALRLPALVAGLLVVPATYVAVRLLYGARPALIATALVATSEETIAYAVNARGYSIVTLAFLVLVVLAVQLQRERSVRAWVGWVLVGALGLWTIPVMLFPLGTVTAWMALSSLRARAYGALRELALATVGVGALAAALYAPVVAHSGLASLTRNDYVVPASWRAFGPELVRNAADTLEAWSASMPAMLATLLALAILLALTSHGRSSRWRDGVPHAAALWCTTLLAINHRTPPERVWQWMIPIAAALAGAGVMRALTRVPRAESFLAERFAALVVTLGMIGAASVLFT